MARDPLVLRGCLALLRIIGVLVPPDARLDWLAEWEAEVRCRWLSLERKERLDWRARMDLIRRALGALPDATWLRRQFTLDADLVHDLRHGMRMLRKSWLFTGSAVCILALGIGGVVAVTTLLDTLMFRALPYAEADRIVTLWTRRAATPAERHDVSPADFLDWRERARSFDAVAAAVPYSYDYTGSGDPEVLFGAQVSEGFWDVMGIRPVLGRAFLPADHVPKTRSVIVAHSLWQQRFGGAPDVVGRTLVMDGDAWTIVGVLPRDFAPQLLPRPGELVVWTPKVFQDFERRTRSSAWWNVVARLRPGVTVPQAQSEMDAISASLAKEYPRSNTTASAVVLPLREHLMGQVRTPLLVMLGAVALVLGIGCANVASLLLARGIEREREFAVRAALGAGRTRLVRQLVAESLLLSAIAGGLGIAVAHGVLRAIVALAPAGVLRLQDAVVDLRIVAFAAMLATVTAITFGLVPALQFSRPGRSLLRSRQSEAPHRVIRRGLVVAEVAVALVLLTGAGLLIRSFERLVAVDPGFSPANVAMVQVFAYDRNTTAERLRNFQAATLERMRALPGVAAVGSVSAMPFATANIDIRSPIEVVGRPASDAEAQRGCYITVASPGYFDALSIPLREGRLLDDRDAARTPRVALISDALRRREWPAASPLGQRIRLQWVGRSIEVEIVGVVSEIRHDRLDVAPRPEVFLPFAQEPYSAITYVLRGAGEPAALIDAAKRAIWSVDPLQTVYDSGSVQRMMDASLARERFSASVMTAFALIALFLCTTGIYGIISFTTAQRTREFGVRIALGAGTREIQQLVLREGSIVITCGLALGLAGAYAASSFLQALLFEIRAGDPLTFAAVCALLLVVGLGACYVPARRATRVDPLVALRAE